MEDIFLKLVVKDSTGQWDEKITTWKYQKLAIAIINDKITDAMQFGQLIVDKYNATLRPNERARELVDASFVDDQGATYKILTEKHITELEHQYKFEDEDEDEDEDSDIIDEEDDDIESESDNDEDEESPDILDEDDEDNFDENDETDRY